MQYNYIFRFGMTQTWLETALYIIGASDSLQSTDIEPHNNDNSLYVAWTGEDSTLADGTRENPYRTIQYARDMLDSNHTIITILDSNYYYTGDEVLSYFDVDGIVLQGAETCKPILTIDVLLASQTTMLRIQNSGKIINCDIQVPNDYTTQVLALDAREGEAKYVTINNANDNAVQKSTADIFTMNYCEIKNSRNEGTTDGSGIVLTEGTLNLNYCLVHDNDYCGVLVSGSAVKTLNIDYSTITLNQYGVDVHACSNLSMTVTNSIIYKNRIYDHYGDVAVYSYACIGKVQGNPTLSLLTNILRINPLFVSNDDFRLRTKYNGYADNILQSPCVGISSDFRDLGCYQYTRSLSGENYIEFTTTPAGSITKDKDAIDAKVVTTNSKLFKLIHRGIKNVFTHTWAGTDNVLTETEYNNLAEMFDSDVHEIYLSQDNGVTYKKYLYDKTKGMSAGRALNKDGNNYHVDVKIILIEV